VRINRRAKRRSKPSRACFQVTRVGLACIMFAASVPSGMAFQEAKGNAPAPKR
jgi:hypothetical protein